MVVEPHLLGTGSLRWCIERGGVKSCCNDGDAEVFAQIGVGAVSPDDFGSLACSLLNVVGDFHDFVHEDLLCAKRDVQQDEVGARDVAVVQERAFKRIADGLLCASLSRSAARSHDCASAVAHDGVDVVHVHVDFPGQRDDFRDAFGGGAEDLVCVGEGAADGLVAKQFSQLVVADDEKRVHSGAHGFEAFRGLLIPAATFKQERDRDDAHRQDAALFARLRNHRGCAGSRAAPHACRDKHHAGVRSKKSCHFVQTLNRRVLADLGE